jgi:hypothetical protein
MMLLGPHIAHMRHHHQTGDQSLRHIPCRRLLRERETPSVAGLFVLLDVGLEGGENLGLVAIERGGLGLPPRCERTEQKRERWVRPEKGAAMTTGGKKNIMTRNRRRRCRQTTHADVCPLLPEQHQRQLCAPENRSWRKRPTYRVVFAVALAVVVCVRKEGDGNKTVTAGRFSCRETHTQHM